MLLARLARSVIRRGRLVIIDAHGRRHEAGDGNGPRATIRLHERHLHTSLGLNPLLRMGEAYMDGSMTIEEGTLYDFLDVCSVNEDPLHRSLAGRSARAINWVLRNVHQYNPVGRARRNAAHHYDLSNALYDLFLDRDRQYSCAYFTHPHDDLEQAQQDKKLHIAAKLLLAPGQRVLDIGCGWGGLALHLAQGGAAEVVGISLGAEQIKVANTRAARAGLADRVRFELCDYREVSGRFDRIVSVGMFEHVGVRHYPAFFAKIAELLPEDGVALLHTIGRIDGPGATNPWMRKYIFPGGYAPALSEVASVIERSGLWMTDIEVLRVHYAETLRLWRERFAANRERVAQLYDERFCRMWEFYLVGAEMSFRRGGHAVFQIQLARDRAAVPLTRDYITEVERSQQQAIAAE
jgi:cyclopropane-fatty-acyl-phospholipid synthase